MAGNRMGEETKEKILLAAEQEFLENGYEKARMEEIARRAGVTKVMLYYHFSTKQNMFNEIVKKMVSEIRREFQDRILQTDLSNQKQFQDNLKAMIAFYQQRQSIIRLVVSEQVSNRQSGESLAVFNDIFELILSLTGPDTGIQQQEFLTRLFFFNALPMLMYACLAEQFCEDFKISPEKSLEIFTETFTRSFIQHAANSRDA